MQTSFDAQQRLLKAWPYIVQECRQVLGSELFYQALVYHCLRTYAQVPLEQLGMNVKMYIANPVSDLFKIYDVRKHEDYRGGFEPIPDVCFFSSQVNADWRRRDPEKTLKALLLAIEIKASERDKGRLSEKNITDDILKLVAHKQEANARGSDFLPVMLVIDTAPLKNERMTAKSMLAAKKIAQELQVGFLYVSPDEVINTLSA